MNNYKPERNKPAPCPICGKHRGRGSDHSTCLEKLVELESKPRSDLPPGATGWERISKRSKAIARGRMGQKNYLDDKVLDFLLKNTD